ncbi:hypothetical protein Tco_1359212 [Tanacetum coccineum]
MFDHVVGSLVGCSGGILCMWNPNMFVKEQVSTCDYFVALMGTWAPTSSKLLIISVYAPQELNERRDLWDYLLDLRSVVQEVSYVCDYFVALMGTWAPTSSKLLIISVYSPQELNERRDL